MGEAEELAAKGRIVNEYTEAKNRLATLEAEIARMAGLVNSVSNILNQRSFASPSLQDLLTKFPSGETLQDLINDSVSTKKRLNEAKQSLKQLGIDVA